MKIPKISIKKRKKIINLQKKIGQINFYKKLIKIDPKIQEYINFNDTQRSVRAYEVKLYTKKSLIDWYKNTRSFFVEDNFIKLYLDCPRHILLDRIINRTKKMLPDAIKEVKKIKNYKVPKNNSSNKIIGINEIKMYLDNKLNKDQTIELMVIKTRQYAKRQATWARGQMKNWKKVNYKDLNDLLFKFS